MPGKMLATREDPRRRQPPRKRQRSRCNDRRIGRKRPITDNRIVGPGVHVEDRREIQVDSYLRKFAPDRLTLFFNVRIAPSPQRRRRRMRRYVRWPPCLYSAAFLVNSDNCVGTGSMDLIAQRTDLLGRHIVAIGRKQKDPEKPVFKPSPHVFGQVRADKTHHRVSQRGGSAVTFQSWEMYRLATHISSCVPSPHPTSADCFCLPSITG